MVTRTQFHDGTAGTGLRQKTLKRPIPCRGIGLHSGATVTMQLCPAPADHGIRFLRTDVSDRDPWIAARSYRAFDTRYALHCVGWAKRVCGLVLLVGRSIM